MITQRRPRSSMSRQQGAVVLRTALLGNFHDAGLAIDRCVDGRGKAALFALPALRERVVESLEVMRDAARDMPAADKAAMSGVDWCAWENLRTAQSGSPREWRERLWQVIEILLPRTLAEIRRYRSHLPGGL